MRAGLLWLWGITAAVMFIGFPLPHPIGAVGVVMPMALQINDLYAARQIEGTHPEFRNSLISALQLGRHGDLPTAIRRAIAHRAAGDVSGVDVETVVNTAALLKAVIRQSMSIVKTPSLTESRIAASRCCGCSSSTTASSATGVCRSSRSPSP